MKLRWIAIAVTMVALIAALVLFLRLPNDDLAERLAAEDTGSWVSILDPARAAPGYTLVLYRGRLPALIDLSSRVVHSWPEVRAIGRARLGHDGHLLVISRNDCIEEYDWEGRLLFRYTLSEGHRPHHDVIRLRNGNILVLAHFETEIEGSSRSRVRDYLIEVDHDGAIVWRWNAVDHADRFETWDHGKKYPSHINSVHELEGNPAFAAGDQRFRPGNLLVSARDVHTIFVIDKASGEVVWQRSDGFDFQHEALMVPAGHPRAGQIVVFNNGLGDRESHRRSQVQIFDPGTLEKIWEYSALFFYSSVSGTAQPLWNGNLMVASSRGGRVFELAPDGDVVWQWEPPERVKRPLRYPRDHCPQLADIEWIRPEARTRATPFVDMALYDFLVPLKPRRFLPGWEENVLREPTACRQLIIPPQAVLTVEYGLHEKALGGRPFSARFVVEIRGQDSGETTRLLDDEVRSDQRPLAHKLKVSLADYAFATIDLCVDAQPLENPRGVTPEEAMVWMEPRIRIRSAEHHGNKPPLSQAERDLRERQLRTLGYIQ